MNDLLYYMIGVLFLFLTIPVICFYVHIKSDKLNKLCRPRCQINSNNWIRAWQCANTTENIEDYTVNDRQGNAFTVHDEASRENRFNDIFFIEPNSIEAARIRAQLEKDEKDLPSYEEVMRMANLSSPTAAPAVDTYGAPVPAVSIAASSSSVNTTDTTLSTPAYREVDLSATSISRTVTPPPYSPPTTASIALPITTPLHSQQTSSNV